MELKFVLRRKRLAYISHVIYDKFCSVFGEGKPLQLGWCAANLIVVKQGSLVLCIAKRFLCAVFSLQNQGAVVHCVHFVSSWRG